MDNPDRSKSVAAIWKRIGELEENQSKYPRPRTPRDPYWMKSRKFALNESHIKDGNSLTIPKNILKSDSDQLLFTGRHIDNTKTHVKDSKTETASLSLDLTRNEAVSLDRWSNTSRIPITSPRKNLDVYTRLPSPEGGKTEALISDKGSNISRIPITSPRKSTDVCFRLPSPRSRKTEAMSLDRESTVRSRIPITSPRKNIDACSRLPSPETRKNEAVSLDRESTRSRIPITSPRKNINTCTRLPSPETWKNESVSLDRESPRSMIPIASPRKDTEAKTCKSDLKKRDKPLNGKKSRSKIPLRIRTKSIEKEGEKGVNFKKFQRQAAKRSKIPVLIKRKTEKTKKEKKTKATNPSVALRNNSSKLNETRSLSDIKTNERIKDPRLSTKIIPDTKVPPLSESTQIPPKTRELNTADTPISESTSSSLKKSSSPSYEQSGEKIFDRPVGQISIDSSCKPRSKRLKKRKERKRHVKVVEASSDEELEEKMPSKTRRRVRRRRKTLSATAIGPEDINMDIKETKPRNPPIDGANVKTNNRVQINRNLVDGKTSPEKSVGAEAYPTTNSSNLTNSEIVGHSGLYISSSLSSHRSDVQHTRGGKTVIKFNEQVQLIRHEDLSAEVRPLKTYSGSNQREFQQLSFVEHVEKAWKRFKNLFKCCACGNEE